MDLVTDDSILWYFPPDDQDDIPRYAIQSSKDKPYEKIIPMIKDDVIVAKETDGGQYALSLLQFQLGKVEARDKKVLDGFLKKWQSGLKFLERKELGKNAAHDDIEVNSVSDSTHHEQKNEENHSLRSHLREQEDEFLEERDLSVRFLTWNLHGAPIYNTDTDLSQLFMKSPNSPANNEKADDCDMDCRNLFDIYFVAFQEIVPLSAKNLRSSPIPIAHWITKILNILGDDYKVIQTNKLLGLASILIIRDELSLNIQSTDIGSIGTGILNVYGNKGAISTTLKIQDFELCFLNCHFAAGEKEQFLLKRRRELLGVKTYLKLPNSNGSLISNDKSILFDVDEVDNMLQGIDMESDEESEEDGTEALSEVTKNELNETEIERGKKDTLSVSEKAAIESDKPKEVLKQEIEADNQTLKDSQEANINENSPSAKKQTIDGDKNIIFIGGDLNYRIDASNEIIQALLKEKDYKSLIDYDTLTLEKDRGRILDGFEEGPIRFPPSYKIDEVTGDYFEDRKPSYTDRVFVSRSKYVTNNNYKSPEIILSDHRPVISDYSITLQIINNKKRSDIVTKYLKQVDDIENNHKKTSFQIDDLENHIEVPILTSTTVEVKITNTGDWKSYWEIIDSVENTDKKFPGKHVSSRVEPVKGVLPKKATQLLKITATLPIGCKTYERTLILRGYNSQDHFITCKFTAKASYFGSSVDELSSDGRSTGIPKSLYTLINYLTNNIIPDMFDETKLNFTHELEKKLIKAIDNDEEFNQKELARADQTIAGSSSRAVSRVLLLLLRNLDGGIVSSDLSTFLLSNYKNDEDVLEKILENLPALRANVLIYLSSFLRLCIESGISKDEVFKKFENILLEVPKQRKRDYMLGRTNYEKLRREFLQKLLG